ncbi:MAG: hypothetical protein R2867_18720 [Caldilineaceae bacterium]
MLRTLQSRFALSHLLPVLLIIPLIGLASIYLIESRFFLDDLASELVVQGSLIAELIQRDQQLWHDPNAADQLITRLQPNMHARLMLLDGSGHMLSSSLASDEGRVGEVITATVVATAMTGTATWQTNDSSGLHERIVDVALPVFDNNSQVIGIVRLSHGMAEIRARLSTMRWVLVVPFIIGIVAAIALALLLARSLALPLIRLRHAMIQWDINQPPQPIPAHGPEQIRADCPIQWHGRPTLCTGTGPATAAGRRCPRVGPAGRCDQAGDPISGPLLCRRSGAHRVDDR